MKTSEAELRVRWSEKMGEIEGNRVYEERQIGGSRIVDMLVIDKKDDITIIEFKVWRLRNLKAQILDVMAYCDNAIVVIDMDILATCDKLFLVEMESMGVGVVLFVCNDFRVIVKPKRRKMRRNFRKMVIGNL